MKSSRAPKRPRQRPQRQWHLPPPLLHGSEALEGGQIFQEIPDELGVALWQAVRDVMLWAQAPSSERSGVFTAGAEVRRLAGIRAARPQPQVESPLKQLAELVADPDGTRPEVVSLGCRQLAQWAEAAGHLATALSYAQAASLAMPGDVGPAYAIARLAHASGDPARAEIWYRRTVGLARRAREWRPYSRAFRGLGLLAKERGDMVAARYHLIRALRGGRRGGMRQEQAAALHELFRLAVRTGRIEEGDRLAIAAFQAYGSRDVRLRELAVDLVEAWGEQGRAKDAAPLLSALGFASPAESVGRIVELSPAARRAAETLSSSLAARLGEAPR
jgi:hypothetical protein